MPVEQTLLTNSTGGSGTSYNTASISPTSGKLVIVMVHSRDNTAPHSVPTLSGLSMTWTQIETKTQTGGGGTVGNTVTFFRGVANGNSGAITISFASTQARIGWGVIELANVDTGGTNGSNAIVQTATSGSETGSGSVGATLSSFSDANNATMAGFILNGTNPSWTPEAGYTEIFDQTASSYNRGMVEFLASNDTTPRATMVMDESTQEYASVAMELKYKLDVISQECLETVTVTDSIVKSTSRTLLDVITMVDTFTQNRTLPREYSETITIVDTISKLTNKVLSQVITIVDVFTGDKSGQKELAEVVTIDDSVNNSIGKAPFEETITIVDSILKAPNKVLTELVTVVDSIIKSTNKVISEVVTVVDTFVKNITYERTLSEIVTIVDTFASVYAKTLTEVITITDQIQKFLNGKLITIWTKIGKASDVTWTKISRASRNIWTKIGKPNA